MKIYKSINTLIDIASTLHNATNHIASTYPHVAPVLNIMNRGLYTLSGDLKHEIVMSKIDPSRTIKKLVEMQTGGLKLELPEYFKDQITLHPRLVSNNINSLNILKYLEKNDPEIYSDLMEGIKLQAKVPDGVEDTFIELEEKDGDYYVRITWDCNLMNLVVKNFDLRDVKVLAGEWIEEDITVTMDSTISYMIGETILRYVMGDDYIHYVDKSCVDERLDEIRFDMEHPLRDKLLTVDGLRTVFCKGLTSRTLMYEDKIPLLFLNKEWFDDNERPFSIGRLDGILSDNPLANSDIIDDVVHILDFILYEVK